MRTSLSVLLLCALVALIASASPVHANATITIQNNDGVGEGFNDPTPAAPVGGNPGTTVGEQRLIAFQFAADIWGAALDSSVPIVVRVNFNPLTCNATSAVLGSAGTAFIFANFPGTPPYPGPEFTNTWYHSALADKRAGFELNPGVRDINAQFNTNLGQPGCLTGIGWYYGLDNNHGTSIDLVTVLLHEFAHGLGFSQFASLATGAQQMGFTDVYGRNLLDATLGLTWDQMTNAQRVTSAINSRRVSWFGPKVTSEVSGILTPGTPLLHVTTPPAIAGAYPVGLAVFGPPLTSTPVMGSLVQALDPADANGATTFDACSPLTNAAAVAGNIALVDRGTCGFILKVKNAQDAGAIAVVVADNLPGGPPPALGGTDPSIVIPSVRVMLPDGNAIKAQLGGGVSVSMLVDSDVPLGADTSGRALLFTPNPVQGGSSISHFDTTATRNQLMEPAINSDLTHQVSGVDLTLAQMRDVGWFPDADVDGLDDATDNCPNNANPGQEDLDGDGLGDVCDPDDDGDGQLDVTDNCPRDVNPGQEDLDGDGVGDVCDLDDDGDGVADTADNCPRDANPGQEDLDGDSLGDVCDPDDDGDGVLDGVDQCPVTPPDLGLDADGNGCTDTLAGLKAIVQSLGLAPKVANGLLGKLNEAQKALDRGDEAVAINKLNDFISQVEAQRGKSLNNATADLLVAYARNLITLISAP